MVCGRLPFGDDSQVKKQQRNGLIFPTSRTVSQNVKSLLTGMLNPNVNDRLDTYDIILHDWTASHPVKAPQPLSPKPKHSLENCLSLVYQSTVDPASLVLQQQHALPHQANPLMSRIGVYRKRISDAVCQSPAHSVSSQRKETNHRESC